jgi:RNA recognition motif-containing protein
MNIYVGNVPFRMTEGELNDLFANYGSVVSCKLIIDRETGRSKGFAFVEMEDDDEARTAIEELNDYEAGGRNLRVNEARPRR